MVGWGLVSSLADSHMRVLGSLPCCLPYRPQPPGMMEADSTFGGGWRGPLPKLRADVRAGNGGLAVSRASPALQGPRERSFLPSASNTRNKALPSAHPQLPIVSWASISVRTQLSLQIHTQRFWQDLWTQTLRSPSRGQLRLGHRHCCPSSSALRREFQSPWGKWCHSK